MMWASPSWEYSKGDLVWLDTRNLKMDCPSKKLDNKRAGPFTIEEKVGPAGYRLKLPQAWRIYRVFHELLLTLYLSPSVALLRARHRFPRSRLRMTIWSMRSRRSWMLRRWDEE